MHSTFTLSFAVLASVALNALALPTTTTSFSSPARKQELDLFKRGSCDGCSTCPSCYTCNLQANGGQQGYAPYACNDNKGGVALDAQYVIRQKQAFAAAGADTWDLAVAMQETGCRLGFLNDGDSEYPFGDVTADHSGKKTGDEACFGPFKMNWGQIRTQYQPYVAMNLQPSDYVTYGQKINTDIGLAVDIIHALRGDLTNFYIHHRGGASGTPAQGVEYKAGIDYIVGQISGQHDLVTGDGGAVDGKVASYLLQCI